MKTRFLIIGILLVTVLALMTVPVSALDNSAAAAVQGNPTLYSSIILTTNADGTSLGSNYPTLYLSLSPSAPATDSSLIANVSVNNASWVVTVADTSTHGSNHPGRMSPYNTSAPDSSTYFGLDAALTDTLQLSGIHTDFATATAGDNVNVGPIATGGGVQLYTGTASVASGLLHNTFTQKVEYIDPILPANQAYRIDLTYTLTSV